MLCYQDKLYGKIKIKKPILIELINSPSLQRLKGVDQAGYSKPYFPGSYSRFEHSLGVFALLKKFNASLEEQIAGLIHDVSHTSFSHAIDYALSESSGKRQDYQDKIFKDFIKNSEIPKILKKYNFDVDFILDQKNFPLLERPLPEVCADRLDYSMRTGVVYGELKKEEVKYFLENLFIKDKRWVFKNKKSAKKFAYFFLKINRKWYSSELSALMFQSTGQLLKYALKKKYISMRDLYLTDKIVLKKIKKYLPFDKKLALLFSIMERKVPFKIDPKDYDVLVFCKSRAVDPLFLDNKNKKIYSLSSKEKGFQKILEKELKPKKYFIKWLI